MLHHWPLFIHGHTEPGRGKVAQSEYNYCKGFLSVVNLELAEPLYLMQTVFTLTRRTAFGGLTTYKVNVSTLMLFDSDCFRLLVIRRLVLCVVNVLPIF